MKTTAGVVLPRKLQNDPRALPSVPSPRVPISPSRRRFFRIAIVLALVCALAAALLLSLGRLVMSVDPLEQADAIYVLGGTRVNRAFEAMRLYREGYAPRILLSSGDREFAESVLDRQGVHVPTNAELGRDLLTRLGVPASAVTILEPLVDNTAQEAEAVRPLVESQNWRRLIVVCDLPSSRRVGYACRRVFGSHVKVIVRANRDDPFDPARWWATRRSFRAVFYEAPKLVAYWMGLRG